MAFNWLNHAWKRKLEDQSGEIEKEILLEIYEYLEDGLYSERTIFSILTPAGVWEVLHSGPKVQDKLFLFFIILFIKQQIVILFRINNWF